MEAYICRTIYSYRSRVVCCTSASLSFTTSGYNNNTRNLLQLHIIFFWGIGLFHNL